MLFISSAWFKYTKGYFVWTSLWYKGVFLLTTKNPEFASTNIKLRARFACTAYRPGQRRTASTDTTPQRITLDFHGCCTCILCTENVNSVFFVWRKWRLSNDAEGTLNNNAVDMNREHSFRVQVQHPWWRRYTHSLYHSRRATTYWEDGNYSKEAMVTLGKTQLLSLERTNEH